LTPRTIRAAEEGEVDWAITRTLVTGGASFIGAHLVEALLDGGASVRVVDNLSSGRAEYLRDINVEFLEGDLVDQGLARRAVSGIDVIFHLAADHGARGYVDLHQAASATNLALDANLFRAAVEADVGKIVYASSGCVYPNFRSEDPDEVLYLTEAMAGPPYDADNMYGLAKLMGEMTLAHLAEERELKAVSLRYFTAYGERGKEDHAVMAMIARAFLRQDPFVVWGDGRQIRTWTYVSDIVEGTILAAEPVQRAQHRRRGSPADGGLHRLLEALGQKPGAALQVGAEPFALLDIGQDAHADRSAEQHEHADRDVGDIDPLDRGPCDDEIRGRGHERDGDAPLDAVVIRLERRD